MDLNERDMDILGISDKSEVIGLNFFENPNVDAQILESIRKSSITDFRARYSFECARHTGVLSSIESRCHRTLYKKSANYMIIMVTLPDISLLIWIIRSVLMP